MLLFLNVLQYLVLTVWVGAMFGFGALFAPVLFRSLSSRSEAGSIAGETLARIDTLGLVAGGIMLVVTALQAIDSGWESVNLSRLFIAGLMLALVVVSATAIRQKLEQVRHQMDRPIEQYGEEEPLRVEHGKLHRRSRLIFTVNMLLGALLIVLSAVRPPDLY